MFARVFLGAPILLPEQGDHRHMLCRRAAELVTVQTGIEIHEGQHRLRPRRVNHRHRTVIRAEMPHCAATGGNGVADRRFGGRVGADEQNQGGVHFENGVLSRLNVDLSPRRVHPSF